jgi:hypothetical protein
MNANGGKRMRKAPSKKTKKGGCGCGGQAGGAYVMASEYFGYDSGRYSAANGKGTVMTSSDSVTRPALAMTGGAKKAKPKAKSQKMSGGSLFDSKYEAKKEMEQLQKMYQTINAKR